MRLGWAGLGWAWWINTSCIWFCSDDETMISIIKMSWVLNGTSIIFEVLVVNTHGTFRPALEEDILRIGYWRIVAESLNQYRKPSASLRSLFLFYQAFRVSNLEVCMSDTGFSMWRAELFSRSESGNQQPHSHRKSTSLEAECPQIVRHSTGLWSKAFECDDFAWVFSFLNPQTRRWPILWSRQL